MNIGEANAISRLIDYITGQATPVGRPPTAAEALNDALFLGERVVRTLSAGPRPEEIRERWPTGRPTTARDELTDGERAALGKVARIRCANDECRCPEFRRGIADLLRAQHPELSDVALARIVLEAGGLLIYYAQTHHLSGTGAAAVIAGAALELASLEIGETHP